MTLRPLVHALLLAATFSRPLDAAPNPSPDRGGSGRPATPLMGMNVGAATSYGNVWVFVDMMKHSREWRTWEENRTWTVVEDPFGWPVSLLHQDGRTMAIDDAHSIYMYAYYRGITGDVVLAWKGDGDVSLEGNHHVLSADGLPVVKRRVYTFRESSDGVFKVRVARSNPADPVREIRMWMPGFEGSQEVFHPIWTAILEPFPCLRFMEWGKTNGSLQKEWGDRTTLRHMRQTTNGTAYEYMLRLCNELQKDAWICVPAMASDDYVRELARLIKENLHPDRRVYIEYSNELWNSAFSQTHWLWDQAQVEIDTHRLTDAQGTPLRKWEYASVLYGRRSAEIWKIMARELGDPERIVRVIAHWRWLNSCMGAALDPAHGDSRVDLITTHGYFISHDALTYAQRNLEKWNLDDAMDVLEQLHLLGKAMEWREEIGAIKRDWPGIPVSCYEGGQHFANPFDAGLQGAALVDKMIAVNADPRIRKIYRTALETWHMAGGDGFMAFTDCGEWGKFGCWGHKRYMTQPVENKLDADGNVLEQGAYKYAALLDYTKRWSGGSPSVAPEILTSALPDATVGDAYHVTLDARGGSGPYHWSLLGGRLPEGLSVTAEGQITGTPAKAEQVVSIIDCSDNLGQHASRVLGLFIDPMRGAKPNVFRFSEGLPAGWEFLGKAGGIEPVDGAFRVDGTLPFFPPSGTPDGAGYAAEVIMTPGGGLNEHHRLGLAFCLSPSGDKEDYLRVAVDGLGRHLSVYSRYLKDGNGAELWGPRTFDLVQDAGEDPQSSAWDCGEYWAIRATIRPGSSPGTIDLIVSVRDERNLSRIAPAGRYDVANGSVLMRELVLKDALRSGPFGLLATGPALVKEVRWLPAP